MPVSSHRTLLPALALLALSTPAWAVPPKYHVETQLEGLSVNYDVENSEILTTINASNHTGRNITCDAEATLDGQDKLKSTEQTIAPGKVAAFSFKHSKIIKKVTLYLMCSAKGASDKETSETGTVSAPKKSIELSPHITIEEL